MNLTPAQLLTLKNDIAADGELSQLPHTTDNAFFIAAAYNLNASPAFIVWRMNVTRREILQNGFDWTRLDNLSVGKARVWSDIFVDGSINPSKDNVRTGIESVWVGTAPDLAVRAAVYVHCKRDAKRFEKLFSTGTGSVAVPAKMPDNFSEVNNLNYQDIESAWNS